MSLIAVVVGAAIAACSRRLAPALAGALVVFVLTTAFLVGVAGPSGSGHELTTSFWVIQAVLLGLTVAVTTGVARLRAPRHP